jgi:glycosyltransferase involved in cell wall biosynthesis
VKVTLPKITIVVPFRNIQNQGHFEDPSFANFLSSLKSISGLVREVILVNDHSTDNSVERIESFKDLNWKILSLENGKTGKKAALELGVQVAETQYVWTLDSDVEILNLNTRRFEKFQNELHEDLVILPVFMKSGRSVLEIFQCNEWRYMQLLTWMSARMKMPMMCNGANLIFKRSVFLANIESHRTISSGDDLFLLAHTIRNKGEIGLCWKGFSDVVISPVEILREALEQRLRWAGKTTKIPVTISSVLHFCFALFSVIHLLAFLGCFFSSLQGICLVFLLVKISFEVVGIYYVFSSRMGLKEIFVLIPQLVLYPFFSLFIFISSMFYIPKWKDRRVSLS